MQICWNLNVLTCEINSSELNLWQVLAFWNHCGSVDSAWILVAQSRFSKTVLFIGIYYCQSGKMMESKLIYQRMDIQGVSHWNVRLYMVLRDGRINNFVDFSLKSCSRGVDIWVLSINFYINDIACPPQPQVWRMPKLNLKFHDSNRKKSCLENNKVRCF